MNRILLLILLCCSAFVHASLPKDSITIKIVGNRTFIVHKVEKKETLFSIAKLYHISIDSIQQVNNHLKVVKVGGMLLIPYAKNSMPDSSVKNIEQAHANADAVVTTIVTKHRVAKGETLAKIATKYNITTNDIIKWNNLREAKIDIGQTIIINGMAANMPYKPWNKQASNSIEVKTNKTDLWLAAKTDMITEAGLALVVDGKQNVMKGYPLNKQVKITNIENGKQTILNVESDSTNRAFSHEVILLINKQTANLLNGSEQSKFNVEINYLPSDK